MLKIYLAGPFFNDKQIATIEAIENEFDKYGFDYFSPRKSGGVISDLSLEDRAKESKRIYDSNVSQMIRANLIFAIVDGRDTGTVYEMGYFRALTDNPKSWTAERRRSVTYTNENFGLNIMLKESVDAHVVGELDLKKFCAALEESWEESATQPGGREKIFRQFQNFNPDVI
jgi:nucleoside 2-deoxyribosyltransferase